MTTALPGGQGRSAPASTVNRARLPGRSSRQSRKNPWQQHSRSLMTELLTLLPSREVASLLVDTYFDRIHWFMLIFHQDDFRRSWHQMYDLPREQLADSHSSPSFVGLFLVVIASALQYTGAHRRRLLESYDIDPTALKEKLFSSIRAKILDIVSLGSLEVVQTCVLLGAYYLYHGNPGLAWPVCGCGLRIAQALNLHRKWSHTGPMSSEMLRQYETRKRCWWAIYEIETFCSMSYGYPHGIKDEDCDVELLDPLAQVVTGQSPPFFSTTHQCPASLLSYKYLMSTLSILIKDILTDLYGLGFFKQNIAGDRTGSSSILNSLIRKVSVLDARLQQWKSEIPATLQLTHPRCAAATYSLVEEMDRDVGASGPVFETHLYQLQALALELAYENAKILIHRPLLTYKTIPHSRANPASDGPRPPDPLQVSLQACRDAALKTSEIESTSIFPLAADTYAAAFIGIHTFTAGVTLCILASIEPLGPQSYHSKLGLRRLLSMQGHLKSRSHALLAAQGVEMLERLTRLVMEKELKEMLPSSEAPLPEPCATIGDEEDRHEVNRPPSNGRDLDIPGTALNEGIPFDYVEDPAVSQVLYDFDQGRHLIEIFVGWLPNVTPSACGPRSESSA